MNNYCPAFFFASHFIWSEYLRAQPVHLTPWWASQISIWKKVIQLPKEARTKKSLSTSQQTIAHKNFPNRDQDHHLASISSKENVCFRGHLLLVYTHREAGRNSLYANLRSGRVRRCVQLAVHPPGIGCCSVREVMMNYELLQGGKKTGESTIDAQESDEIGTVSFWLRLRVFLPQEMSS